MSASRRPFGALLVGAWLLSLPAVFGRAPVENAVEWVVREGFQPGFVHDASPLLVHLWVPLVGVSAAILFLLPGLFLVAAMGRRATLHAWVLEAFALSLPLVSVLAGLVGDLRGTAFGLAVLALSTACWGLWVIRARGSSTFHVPAVGVRELAIWLAVPLAFTAILAPKFLWESFNGDGVHAFESARLLLTQPVPFWPAEAGGLSSFPGVNSYVFAYPMSWYLRLLGAHEAGARLPLLLFMILLYAGVRALGGARRSRSPGPSESWLAWVGVVTFAWAMSFSATYNPYVADIALPATQDMLAAACFLAFLWAVVEGRMPWAAAFGYLTLAGSPSGLLLLGLWILARAAVTRPLPLRELGWTVGILVGAMMVSSVLPPLLTALGQPVPGGEYGLGALLGRFENLQFTDVGRILYVVIPCGLIPALVLFQWRRQDDLARAVSLTALAYFGVFFVQAYVSLHQFFPSMVLPLAVLWRTVGDEPAWRGLRSRSAILAGGVVALALQWSGPPRVDVSGRLVGGSFEDRIGGYEDSRPDGFRTSSVMYDLFPATWTPEVPASAYGGSALIWYHYAHREPLAGTERAFLIQESSAPDPAGARLAAVEAGAALWVRSDSVLESYRALRPRSPAGSPLLTPPRGVLFANGSETGATRVVVVRSVLSSIVSKWDALRGRGDGRP